MSTYRVGDDDSSDDSNSDDESSTSSSYSGDYGGDPDWMKKFNLGTSKTGDDDRKRRMETEISMKEMNTQHISKSTDGMKKFDRIQDGPPSTSSPMPTTDDCKRDSDSGYGRNINSLKSRSDPDSKQNSNNVRKSAEKVNKTEIDTRETNKCSNPSSSRSIDRAERRKRIRQNLEKLRRRERRRENLSSLKGQRKKEQQRKYPPTVNTRVKKYEKPTLIETKRPEDKREPSEHKNDRAFAITPKISNQTTMKNGIDQPEKTSYQKWSEGKTATNSATSSYQRDIIKLPSIDSKVNSLREAVKRNNMNKNTRYEKSDRKTKVVMPRLSSARSQHANTPSPQIKTTVPVLTHQKAESRLNDGVPESQLANSSPPQVKTTAPAATHQKAESHLNDDVPEIQIVGTKFHSTPAEIETSVPKNLFGMWGETVKVKKPTADAPRMSHRMLRNQADRIKKRIDRARKEAIHAGGHHNGDLESVGDEKSVGIKVDPDESASALFFGAYANTSDDKNSINMDKSVAKIFGSLKDIYGEIESDAKEESDGDDSMDEDAAALFYGVGFDKNTEKNDVDKFEYKTNDFDGEDSIRIDEAETMEESNRDNSMNEDAAALFHGVSSDKNMGTNDADEFEYKTNELDGEDSIDMDSAAPFDGVDSSKNEANDVNHNFEPEMKQGGVQKSISMDNSAAAIFGVRATINKQRDDDDKMKSGKKEESDGKKSVDVDITASLYGTGYGKYRSAPDLNSSSSDSTDSGNDSHKRKSEREDLPTHTETSKNESFDDVSSCSHSTDDSVVERKKKSALEKNKGKIELKSGNIIDSGKKEKKVSKMAVKQKVGKKKRSKSKDTRKIKKEDENQRKKDGKSKSNDSKRLYMKSEANESFDEEGSFVASDFSVDSLVVDSLVVQKNAKKTKKPKLKKSRLDKKLSSKKKEKKK
jgi:hypothetical protein